MSKKLFKLLFLLNIWIFCLPAMADSDPLLLSQADMQKLQRYFPNNDNSGQLVWNGTPLKINLPPNQEKRLIFPERVSVDVRGQLTTAQLKITNDDGQLYLTALTPFAKTRIYVTLLSSNQVILLDLATDKTASAQAVKIAVNTSSATSFFSSSSSANSSTDTPIATSTLYVNLLRHAWQQLYAPDNLVPADNVISRVAMQTPIFISDLVYGDKVLAHPLASWQQQNVYITAVELRNAYPHVTMLHIPQDICGDWLAASVYPRYFLAPVGDKNHDSTTLFLISAHPFMNALENCHAHA